MHVKGGTGGASRLVSFPFIFKHDQNLSLGNKYQVGTSRHPPAPACPLPRAGRGEDERRAGVAMAAAVPGAPREAALEVVPADAAPLALLADLATIPRAGHSVQLGPRDELPCSPPRRLCPSRGPRAAGAGPDLAPHSVRCLPGQGQGRTGTEHGPQSSPKPIL